MVKGFPDELKLKPARMPYKQSGTIVKVNGTMPKRSPPIMAETDGDVVHYPIMENKHWMFDPRFAEVINQFAHFPIWWHWGLYPEKHRLFVLGR